MMKIIEGHKEEFEKKINEMEEQGFLADPTTHHVFEYLGKPYYSVLVVKSSNKEMKK